MIYYVLLLFWDSPFYFKSASVKAVP